MNEAVAPPSVAFILQITSGPMKGATFKLVSSQVSLGRSEENDVVLRDDPKVSRKHVALSVSPEASSVSNISGKNIVYLNGKEVSDHALKSGDTIQVGETKFTFKMETSELSLVANNPLDSAKLKMAPVGPQTPYSPRQTSTSGMAFSAHNVASSNFPTSGLPNTKPKSKLFYIVVGVVVVIAASLFLSSGKKSTEDKDKLISDEARQLSIDEKQRASKEYKKRLQQSGKTSPLYREAQANYLKGFRDYKQGQYERAIESFQACLSIYPQHSLCQRYYRLAQKRTSELVQQNMILGRTYHDKSQYRACAAAFKSVMLTLKNPSDKVYQEAKANYNSCRLRMEGR